MAQTKELTGVQKARKSMGITQGIAARLLGVSLPTYAKLERNPQQMTVGQFGILYREFDDEAQQLMTSELEKIGVK